MASLPLYFLPLCLSLAPVFAFALRKHECGVERVTHVGRTRPLLLHRLQPFGQICVSLSAVALSPIPLTPRLRFPLLWDRFAGDLTAVINDLGGPGGRQRGAVRKHNKLVIPLQTSLLLTAPVFYPSGHYDFWGGKEDLRYEGYIGVKFWNDCSVGTVS